MLHTTHFFLGANSGQGFTSLFGRFCAPEDHYDLAVLKGGPGCGKSTLMRRVGEAMEAKGETVEYLHCSGDPDSLDAVRIPRLRTSFVDGTAPHVVEPQYPAAVDRYLDLGRFYDLDAAKAAREEIIRHSKICSEAYRRAYRAMGAARQVSGSAAALMAEGMDEEKLLRRADGIISRELRGKGSGGGELYRFLGSLTCQGPVWRFDSVAALCPKVYQLQDSFGFAAPLLERLRAAAAAKGCSAVVCPDPEHPDRVEHLLLPEQGVAFVTSREDMAYTGPAYRRVRVDAMVAPSHGRLCRSQLRFLRRMEEALRQEALTALGEAKTAHDALEAAYRSHVDFAGVDEVTDREIRRLESRL